MAFLNLKAGCNLKLWHIKIPMIYMKVDYILGLAMKYEISTVMKRLKTTAN